MGSVFTPKTTKAEIIAAYEALEQENEKLRDKLSKFMPVSDDGSTSSDADISTVATALQSLQPQIGNAFGGYQNAVADELTRLKSLQLQFQGEVEQLQQLYGITFESGTTLGNLVTQFDKLTSEQHEREQEAAILYENEASDREIAWADECARREAAHIQSDEDYDTALLRDEEEYQYARKQIETRDEDEEELQAKAFQVELTNLKKSYEDRWKADQKALTEREEACRKLSNERQTLETKLQNEIKAATAMGENIARKQATHTARIVSSEHKAQISQKEIEIVSKREDIASNNREIERLQQLLNKINADNQALSSAALTSLSAASVKAAEVAERIAMEHARSTSGKR